MGLKRVTRAQALTPDGIRQRRGQSHNPRKYSVALKGEITIIITIDSIMGSGKTTWAINYMNAHPEQRYIFVTPYLKEIARIQEACSACCFVTPQENPYKQADFLMLLGNGQNIAITHELFCSIRCCSSTKDRIAEQGYILFMDEVVDVVKPVEETMHDIRLLFETQRLGINKETHQLKWMADNYDGRFNKLKASVKAGNIYQSEDNVYIWKLPPDIIIAFETVYILTFLFAGSHMEQYLTIHGIKYEKYHINDGILCPGEQDLQVLKYKISKLIDIYEGPLNQTEVISRASRKDIQSPETMYSKTWWLTIDHKERRRIFNNVYNYLHNIQNALAHQAMWSVFTSVYSSSQSPSLNGRFATSFCPCNTRASNDYRERTVLAYPINVYGNPIINNWFARNGGTLDPYNFALSRLLQWVWRSAIREGNPIHLYLPSFRMRTILVDWLHSDTA